MSESNQPAKPGRRSFIKSSLAFALGGLAGAVPAGVGVYVFCDPLRLKSGNNAPVRITSLEALPNDGIPRKFTVVADQEDAWNRYPLTPIGAVYLRRTGEQKVEALNVVCPHAGCFVDYLGESHSYLCPCHRSTFTLEGAISDPHSPSPRGLDSLAVEIRNGTEVWVKFQNFIAGQKEKVPVA
jgi:menaquinol-cytochrome c reductase iron-sulfur subunit